MMLYYLIFASLYLGCFSFGKTAISPLKNISYTVPHENYVYILNETHFDFIVRIQPIMLVQLYVNNDVMHRYMDLDYEKAAKLSSKTIKVPFGMIKLNSNSKYLREFMFSDGFQLLVFKKGIPFAYIGPEDSKGIVNQLERYSDPTWVPTTDETIKLNLESINNFISDNLSFIFVYDQDKRSKLLLPMFKIASVQLKHFFGLNIGIIDGIKYPQVTKLFNLTNIPEALHCIHKKCYHNMNHVMYIQDFIGMVISIMHGGRAINNKESFFKRSQKHWMMHEPTYIALIESDDSTEMRILEHAVYAFHNTHSIYYSLDKNLKKYFNCTYKECFRVCYPPFLMLPGDEETIEANMLKDDELKNFDKVASYITKNTLPLVAYKYHYNYRVHYYFKHSIPLLIVYGPYSYNNVYYDHYEENNIEAHNKRMELLPLALNYKKLQFCVSHIELLSKSMLKNSSSVKSVVIIFDEDGYTYLMNTELDSNRTNIDKFITEYYDEKLVPHDISDELPIRPYDEEILVLVTKNFLKEVRKKGRDMFLIMYHSSTHHIMYEKMELHSLVDMLHQNSGIVIAKIRYDSNSIPKIFSDDQSTFYYLIKNGDYRAPIIYKGDFLAISILKFLEKHSTHLRTGWPAHIIDEL